MIFYISWIFDNGCETGLSNIGEDVFSSGGGSTCQLNTSIMHTNAAPLGGDKRIEGARIYFNKQNTTERVMVRNRRVNSTLIPLSNLHVDWY